MPESVASTCRLFADDSILYREIRSTDDTVKLQSDLNKLSAWEKDWGMSFNPSKCNIMHITRKRKPILSNYYLKGEQLEAVDSSKYLGVTISKDLTWHSHINNVAAKGNQSLGFVRRNIPISAPRATKEMAYKSLVRPQLEYSACVWDPHQQFLTNKVEMVQHRAARYVMGYPRFSRDSVSQMLQTLQWQQLEQRRKIIKLVMFYKIINNLVAVKYDHLRLMTTSTRTNNNNNKTMDTFVGLLFYGTLCDM